MSVMTNYRNWRRRRDAIHRMRSLSDRQLIDMGVPRWRIEECAKGAPVDPTLVR